MRRSLPLLIVALLLALPAAADARPDQILFFEAPRELRSDDAALRTETLDDMASLGVDHVRLNLFWRDVAPSPRSGTAPAIDDTDPDSYDWVVYDRVISEALERDIDVMLTVTGPGPQWATRDKLDQVTRPDPARFQSFVTAVGVKYGDFVDRWSIWNEPNLPAFLRPQYEGGKVVSGSIYRELYVAGRAGLQAAGQGAEPILMGETAPFGTDKTASPLAFLRDAFGLSETYKRTSATKRLDVDGWAHHPYTSTVGPFFEPNDRDDVTIGSIDRLERALDKAARAGAVRRRVPIWVTEFGIQSKPDPFAVSLAKQARFRSIAERLAYKNPRIRSFSQYLMRDDLKRGTTFGGFESGIRFSDGRTKPSYRDFRLPLTATRAGSAVKLWGLVRPASGRTSVTVEVRRGGGSWKRVGVRRTNKHGVWTLRSGFTPGVKFRATWRTFTGIAVAPAAR